VSETRVGASVLRLSGAWRGLLVGTLVVLHGAAAAAPVEAQQQPRSHGGQRGFRGLFGGGPPPDPNRLRQDLSLTASLLGGYDDNLAAAVGGSAAPAGQESGGYLGQSQVDLRYYRGRSGRSFTLDGSAYGTGYDDSAIGFVTGGFIDASGTTRVRTRDTFHAGQRFSFDPFFSLGSLSVLDSVVEPGTLPGSNTTTGLVASRSWSSQSVIDYSWMPSARNDISLNYGFNTRRYTRSDDAPGDSDSHRASAGLTRTLNRRVSLQTSYDYTHGRYQDPDGERPLSEHTISAGPQIEKVFSRTRRLQLTASLGAQYVQTLSSVALQRAKIDYWTPFGDASANLAVSRTWDVGVNYRRGTTVLPEVTTESFVTDALMFGTAGVIGRRLEVDLNAGFSTGTTATAAGGRAQNETLTWSSQLRWAFSRSVAATVSYDYYEYDFTNIGDLPDQFPPGASRNTVRVGVTFFLPLLGNYITERSGGRSGRS
jgi:opacity protein-like surface antigen